MFSISDSSEEDLEDDLVADNSESDEVSFLIGKCSLFFYKGVPCSKFYEYENDF